MTAGIVYSRPAFVTLRRCASHQVKSHGQMTDPLLDRIAADSLDGLSVSAVYQRLMDGYEVRTNDGTVWWMPIRG